MLDEYPHDVIYKEEWQQIEENIIHIKNRMIAPQYWILSWQFNACVNLGQQEDVNKAYRIKMADMKDCHTCAIFYWMLVYEILINSDLSI